MKKREVKWKYGKVKIDLVGCGGLPNCKVYIYLYLEFVVLIYIYGLSGDILDILYMYVEHGSKKREGLREWKLADY